MAKATNVEAVIKTAKPIKSEQEKVVRKFEPEDLVLVRSITQGTLLLPGSKSQILYTWEAYGDIVQVEYRDLYTLKASRSGYLYKDKMSFKEYEQGVNSLVDTISGSMPGITSDMMKASLGIDRELENMAAHYSKVSAKVGKEFADNLSGADLELASDIISEKDVRNAEELKRAMIETKQAAQDINATLICYNVTGNGKRECGVCL